MVEPRAEQSDAVLMARVRAGEHDAFAELVARYRPAPAARVRSRLGGAEWAEDVVQETFLAVFKCAPATTLNSAFARGCGPFCSTSAGGITTPHAWREHRAVAARPGRGDRGTGESAKRRLAAGAIVGAGARLQLEALLSRLSVVQADALRLRFFGGLKFHEIAETMECSLNAAKNRVRLGLEKMAEMLQAAGVEGATPSDEPRGC